VALTRLVATPGPGVQPGWAERLTAHLVEEVGGSAEGRFVVGLDELLERVRQDEGDLSAWHRVIDAIRREALSQVAAPVARARSWISATRRGAFSPARSSATRPPSDSARSAGPAR
jgi:hypothetical protein